MTMVYGIRTTLLALVALALGTGPAAMCWCGAAGASVPEAAESRPISSCHDSVPVKRCHAPTPAESSSGPCDDGNDNSGCPHCIQFKTISNDAAVVLPQSAPGAEIYLLAVDFGPASVHTLPNTVDRAFPSLGGYLFRGETLRALSCLLIV